MRQTSSYHRETKRLQPRKFARLRVSCMVILALCLGQAAYAKTGCTAVTGIDTSSQTLQDTIINQECITTPCNNPGLCKYNGGSYNGHCGPVTKCVLEGEDPPVSNPQWDEPRTGFQGLGASLGSGRCPPPSNSSSYELKCPTPQGIVR